MSNVILEYINQRTW